MKYDPVMTKDGFICPRKDGETYKRCVVGKGGVRLVRVYFVFSEGGVCDW